MLIKIVIFYKEVNMLYTGKEENIKENKISINNDLPLVKCSKFEKVFFIILIVLTLGLLMIKVISIKNHFKDLQIKINESASNIDIQLEKRFSTINNILEVVKKHMEFDKEVFTQIALYRSGRTASDKEEILNKASGMLAMQIENYPNLGADESIRTLNNEQIMIEKEIAASRRLYNSYVTEFNSEIYQWPNNIILDGKGYYGIPLFATSSDKKADLKIKF